MIRLKLRKISFFSFFLFINLLYLIQVGANEQASLGHFLCRSCGETIASSDQLHHFSSSSTLKHWNQTLLGIKNVPVQLFKNPNGNSFHVVTFSTCTVHSFEEVYSDATWFQGFAWKISVCPRCGKHLGWKYQPTNFNHVIHSENDTFYGLILDNLLEDAKAETLLLVPNSYKS